MSKQYIREFDVPAGFKYDGAEYESRDGKVHIKYSKITSPSERIMHVMDFVASHAGPASIFLSRDQFDVLYAAGEFEGQSPSFPLRLCDRYVALVEGPVSLHVNGEVYTKFDDKFTPEEFPHE